MKKLVFAICITMLLKPVMPVIDYVCNYDYIANELCENKDNVVMGCNGKCYLMKQLAKESETEKPLSSDKKHLSTETSDLFVCQWEDFNLSPLDYPTCASNDSNYTNLYGHEPTETFFRPPIIVV